MGFVPLLLLCSEICFPLNPSGLIYQIVSIQMELTLKSAIVYHDSKFFICKQRQERLND